MIRIMIRKAIATMAMATISMAATAQAPAFPGAEGHGRYVTGGRASNGTTKVYHVTNLSDDGNQQGSLRWALKQSGPRTIVFDVGGVIALNSDLSIPANTTIAGQTAPSPGITLRYYTVQPNGNNIIIRFIRSRRGQEKDINDGADAIWTRNKTGIIIDHCSFSWSIDEVASFYDNNNFTMQWCTIAESLVHPGHSKGAHGYGGIWGGKLASFHHNLIAHVANRSPRFCGARYQWSGYTSNKLYSQYQWQNYVQAENVDLRNCLIYNCGNGCYGGPGGGQVNMVNNYFKTGPAANTTRLTTVTVGASGNSTPQALYGTTSRYYLDGNLVIDKNNNPIANITNNNWNGVTYDSGTKTLDGDHYSKDANHLNGDGVAYTAFDGVDYVRIRMDAPCPTGDVTTHSAEGAYNKVMAFAGASLFRDEVDTRYMEETSNGNCTYKGSATSYVEGSTTKTCTPTSGRIDLVSDVNGYTEANFPTSSRPEGFDTDQDGIPDAWETANGLNPNDASDANLFTLDTAKGWYSNLEVYLSSLVEDIMKQGNADAQSTFEEYYPSTATAINTVGEDSTYPVSTMYYTLAGQRVNGNASGVVIQKQRMANGQTRTTKHIR